MKTIKDTNYDEVVPSINKAALRLRFSGNIAKGILSAPDAKGS